MKETFPLNTPARKPASSEVGSPSLDIATTGKNRLPSPFRGEAP
jgi:hypothetical protein